MPVSARNFAKYLLRSIWHKYTAAFQASLCASDFFSSRHRRVSFLASGANSSKSSLSQSGKCNRCLYFRLSDLFTLAQRFAKSRGQCVPANELHSQHDGRMSPRRPLIAGGQWSCASARFPQYTQREPVILFLKAFREPRICFNSRCQCKMYHWYVRHARASWRAAHRV